MSAPRPSRGAAGAGSGGGHAGDLLVGGVLGVVLSAACAAFPGALTSDTVSAHLLGYGARGLLAVALLWLPRRLEPHGDLLGTGPGRRLRPALQGAAAYAFLFPLILGAGWLNDELQSPERRHEQQATLDLVEGVADQPLLLAALVAGVVLVIPLVEETVFRGWLQGGLTGVLEQVAAPRAARAVAVLAAGVAFTLVHEPFTWLVIFPVGLVLGVLYAVTRSLWTCVVFHAAHNAVVLSCFLAGWEL